MPGQRVGPSAIELRSDLTCADPFHQGHQRAIELEAIQKIACSSHEPLLLGSLLDLAHAISKISVGRSALRLQISVTVFSCLSRTLTCFGK